MGGQQAKIRLGMSVKFNKKKAKLKVKELRAEINRLKKTAKQVCRRHARTHARRRTQIDRCTQMRRCTYPVSTYDRPT